MRHISVAGDYTLQQPPKVPRHVYLTPKTTAPPSCLFCTFAVLEVERGIVTIAAQGALLALVLVPVGTCR